MTARFCSACGMHLAPGLPAFGTERKVVSILFVDVVGFTGRAELLDPEEVGLLLTPFYGHVRAELERFGGTVEKFIGDAVMAIFGVPAATRMIRNVPCAPPSAFAARSRS